MTEIAKASEMPDRVWGRSAIRALVVDLDGTLIDHSERISPGVHQAVARLSKRLPVSIATGREAAHVID